MSISHSVVGGSLRNLIKAKRSSSQSQLLPRLCYLMALFRPLPPLFIAIKIRDILHNSRLGLLAPRLAPCLPSHQHPERRLQRGIRSLSTRHCHNLISFPFLFCLPSTRVYSSLMPFLSQMILMGKYDVFRQTNAWDGGEANIARMKVINKFEALEGEVCSKGARVILKHHRGEAFALALIQRIEFVMMEFSVTA
jgi:hypothetical protein